MDDRKQFKEIEARLASTLTVLIMEIAQTRAMVHTVLTMQGTILLLLGRSEEDVTADVERVMTQRVNEGKKHLEESLLRAFERILETPGSPE